VPEATARQLLSAALHAAQDFYLSRNPISVDPAYIHQDALSHRAAASESAAPKRTASTHSPRKEINTMKKLLALLFAVALAGSASTAFAQEDPMVGGAAMFPTKNIVENALNSKATPPWWRP
jgi:hypothetical protein